MREIDLLGVYVPPAWADILVAIVLFAPLKLALDRLGADRFVWHRPLFDVSLFACTLSGVILLRAGILRSVA